MSVLTGFLTNHAFVSSFVLMGMVGIEISSALRYVHDLSDIKHNFNMAIQYKLHLNVLFT